MNILYIDDNPTRAETHARALLEEGISAVRVSHSLGTALPLLDAATFNAIVSYENVGGESFSGRWPLFIGTPYYIMDGDRQPPSTLPQAPAALLGRTLDNSATRRIVGELEALSKKTPNLGYAEQMAGDDLEFLKELIRILKTQFAEGVEKIPYLYGQNDQEALFQEIHKFTGKFAVLGLMETHLLYSRVEGILKDGHPIPPHAFRRITDALKQGLDFINHYMDTNELHHS